jgi:hypothetical protein
MLRMVELYRTPSHRSLLAEDSKMASAPVRMNLDSAVSQILVCLVTIQVRAMAAGIYSLSSVVSKAVQATVVDQCAEEVSGGLLDPVGVSIRA